MKIEVNGEQREMGSESIEALICDLNISREGIAIAVGMDIIPQSEYGSYKIKDGDEITIIRATKGG